MDDLNIEALGLEIAGVDVHSLMRDLDEIELAVSELTLYGQFYEHFKEGFGLIQHAVHFWLEDGAYNQCAESTIQTMFRQRDVIEEHFSFSEATSLPFIIRQFVGTDHPASDSQLTVGIRIMPIHARRLDQTHDSSRPFATAKRSGKQPV
ncbi:hypothetical protein LOY34_04400 [Pseudomonas sp. B21-009]|uniref:hypothetical protein n=1 Tax=Pseudomonas sp. B21-009 TaxID=2895470 RepID=UPI0021604546|nr:hypothetical protein [Pseudomonas sp. B21-009]UVM69664.1 hypothetical protein LOY34_04400 [Pseudomonas sp. B21-009]